MSFKNALTDVSICNLALSDLAQQPIVSMNDKGTAAAQCRQHYPDVVRVLLEMHHFGLATKQANLVASDEIGTMRYIYTYLLPEDAAHVVRLAYPRELQNTSYYVGLRARLDATLQQFEVEGRVLRTNVVNATVDYVSYNITEADFNGLFAKAVRWKLASAIAMPITKRQDLRDQYEAKADQHINAFLSREANAQRPTYGDGPSEADYARAGAYEASGYGLW